MEPCEGTKCNWFTEVCLPCEQCHEWLKLRGVPHRFVSPELLQRHPAHTSAYELTLTTPPTDPDVYRLRDVVKKIYESAIFDCILILACVELTKEGVPHIHALIYSNKKYLDASKLKGSPFKFPYRYTLKRVRNLDNYYNYIHKEYDTVSIKDYCLGKGIPQFFQCPDTEENPQVIGENVELPRE